ncbi:MAG: DUF2911 domain-containing protein [Acidobacteria bacterium]|nr:DUF2911 domain-containing protein [Acidobacteriota bacterium]
MLAFQNAGRAQLYPKASEKATVSQTVSGTHVEVAYSRPAARGRDIFGALVKWGEVWTPGANQATTLRLERDVKIGGETIAAGRYSMWAVPGEAEWTILLDENADRFHIEKPKPEECRYKLTAKPKTSEYLETLTFTFTNVGPRGATLELHWGPTVVELPIRTERMIVEKLGPDDAAKVTGRYDVQLMEPGKKPMDTTFTIVDVEGLLMGYMRTRASFQLVPTEVEGEFLLAGLREGDIINIEDDPLVVSFSGDGHATGFSYIDTKSGFKLSGKRSK